MKVFKTFIGAAAIFAVSACVYAAPVKMTLTYDGKTREYNAEEITLMVNGAPAELTLMPPVILEGYTYVPSREVFEPLGAIVDWKDASRELYIGYNGTLIVLKPDLDTAEINGQYIPLQTPAKIINNKLMIPARFVAESLGIPVAWDGDTRTVSIGAEQSVPDIYEPTEPQTPFEEQAPEQVFEQVPAPPISDVLPGELSVDISPEPLSVISGNQVTVIGFKADGAVFTVEASGPMTKVEKLLLPENKLVLDIYAAENGLAQSSYAVTGFSGVSAMRNSQFQASPEKITRIVLDLIGANRYSVSFSGDRKSVIVTFQENVITDISCERLDAGERITVTGTLPSTLSASRLFSPERLVFDIPGAKYPQGSTQTGVGGIFAESIRASQFDAQMVRVVVDLKESPQYNVAYEGNRAIITLESPTYHNISYSQADESAVILKGIGVSPADIIHTDDYTNGRYVLTLPDNYSAYLGYGELDINDSTVKSVAIQSDSGRTEIIINQKAIFAYVLSAEGSDLVIKQVNPKSVYETIVYIDAGHGGDDPGAIAHGFQEKNLNLSIALRLYELLESDPEIKVYTSRLDDTYPQNIDRALAANHAADLFVSIHHNAADSAKSNGTEVLYLNHEGEVYPNISSEAVARIIQTNLVSAMGTTDRGVVKRPALIVLNQTTIPAVIVEVIFVTNSDDINKVSTQEGRNIVSESLYNSIKEIFRQYPTGR